MSSKFTKIKVKGANGYTEIPIGANAIDIKYNNTENVKQALNRLDINTEVLEYSGAGAHNSYYRGKVLSNEILLTDTFKNNILNGSFDALYIGDCFILPVTINNITFDMTLRIAHFDYFYNKGKFKCNKHHIILVPDEILITSPMNNTDITTGAYMDSLVKTSVLPNLTTILTNIINQYSNEKIQILSYYEYFQDTMTNGKPSSGGWYSAGIELMNEAMITGGGRMMEKIETTVVQNVNNYAIAQHQLKLFSYNPTSVIATNSSNDPSSYWLRNATSEQTFADVGSYGSVFDVNASVNIGIRPYIPICAKTS